MRKDVLPHRPLVKYHLNAKSTIQQIQNVTVKSLKYIQEISSYFHILYWQLDLYWLCRKRDNLHLLLQVLVFLFLN